MALDHYNVGEPAARRISFKNAAGAAADPAQVFADLHEPNVAVPSTVSYPTTTGPHRLVKDSVGEYTFTLVSCAQVGLHTLRGRGNGNGVDATTLDEFVVDPDPFTGPVLNADALTTLYDAEVFIARLGRQGTDAQNEEDKAFIRKLINGFSAAIHRYTRRQFKPQENAVAKRFRLAPRARSLSLAPSEARNVTAVVVHSDRSASEQRTLTADEYRLEPRGKSSATGTYLWIKLLTTFGIGAFASEAQVTGDWGATAVPADVEYVCLAEVANAYHRSTPIRVRGEEPLPPDIGPFPLSRRSLAVLDRYRRP